MGNGRVKRLNPVLAAMGNRNAAARQRVRRCSGAQQRAEQRCSRQEECDVKNRIPGTASFMRLDSSTAELLSYKQGTVVRIHLGALQVWCRDRTRRCQRLGSGLIPDTCSICGIGVAAALLASNQAAPDRVRHPARGYGGTEDTHG